MTYRKPDLAALQAECDAFNAACRVGGPVAVKLDGTEKPFITSTRSEAQILSGHSAVVWMDGVSGCYNLSHVTPIPEQHEAWAVYADNGNVRMWSRDRAAVERLAKECGKPMVPYIPEPEGQRLVPRLPTPKQLRAAMAHTSDAELAKSIYLAMTSADAITPEPCRNEIINSGAQAIPKSCPRCGHARSCPAGVTVKAAEA